MRGNEFQEEGVDPSNVGLWLYFTSAVEDLDLRLDLRSPSSKGSPMTALCTGRLPVAMVAVLRYEDYNLFVGSCLEKWLLQELVTQQ